MDTNSFAPIAVFVYKRENHTRKLLESLAGCRYASSSDVFIFSDGAKRPEDEKDVIKVRELIHENKWKDSFGSLEITEAPRNKGLANSIIGGVTDVINRYGRIIVLEDDLEVAPNFLTYMNEMLVSQKENEKVFAIAGWTYPFCKYAYKDSKDAGASSIVARVAGGKLSEHTPWLFYRACSWGWATWADRWEKVEFDPVIAGFKDKLSNSEWCKRFSRGGNDLPGMLQLYLDGKIDSWAIRWNVAACDLDMMTVYPMATLLVNNGLDGSGTNCAARDESRQESGLTAQDEVATNPVMNSSLVRKAWKYESDTLDKKIKRNLRVIFVDHKVPNIFMARGRR